MMIAALMLLALQASDQAPPPPASGQQQGAGPQIEAPGAATKAAQQWLALVDAGDATRSWQQTGGIFRSKVTAAQWASELPKVRQPLGRVASREPDGELPLRSLPDAPAGDYRIVRFDTEFANHKQAIETVVTSQEAGGWKVIGFFVADPEQDQSGDNPPPSNRR